MNCEQTREAIDSGIQNEAVHGHLTSCPACQQSEAETSSLLSLLSAQPRVKAPADFETQLQARLQATLVGEEAQLTALLGSLPAVVAPANFEAQLQARLASEEVKIAALVGVLPAIEAPSNFDFHLRARLAQVNAEQTARGPLTWLADFWTKSFSFGSFGQAATAMAALALVVAFSLTQINRETTQPSNAPTLMAHTDTTQAPATRNLVLPAQTITPEPVLRSIANKAVARVSRQFTPAVQTGSNNATERPLVASNLNEQSVLSVSTGQEVKLPRGNYAYGQQLVKHLPTQKADTLSVAF